MKKIIQILTLCALPVLAVAQSNVLRNPGFEYDPSGENQSFPGWTSLRSVLRFSRGHECLE